MPQAAHKYRILLAEDDGDISRLLIETLGRDYEVVCAKNGVEAVKLARTVRPDLLLLDIMMPGLDGMEASRLIRDVEGLGRVPIIFLTAKDQPMDVVRGIQHGARHYITKPFHLADLCKKIRTTLPSS